MASGSKKYMHLSGKNGIVSGWERDKTETPAGVV